MPPTPSRVSHLPRLHLPSLVNRSISRAGIVLPSPRWTRVPGSLVQVAPSSPHVTQKRRSASDHAEKLDRTAATETRYSANSAALISTARWIHFPPGSQHDNTSFASISPGSSRHFPQARITSLFTRRVEHPVCSPMDTTGICPIGCGEVSSFFVFFS